MAQNFRRYLARNVGTSAVTLHTANSYDTVIGIAIANVTTSEIKVDVILNDGSNDHYLIKNAPIQNGGTLQIIDGGAKYVIQSAIWGCVKEAFIGAYRSNIVLCCQM